MLLEHIDAIERLRGGAPDADLYRGQLSSRERVEMKLAQMGE